MGYEVVNWIDANSIIDLLPNSNVYYNGNNREYFVGVEDRWGLEVVFSFSCTPLSCGLMEIYNIKRLSFKDNWLKILKTTLEVLVVEFNTSSVIINITDKELFSGLEGVGFEKIGEFFNSNSGRVNYLFQWRAE